MKRIYVVGAPSTGKTTLIRTLTKILKERKFRLGVIEDPAWDFIVNFGEPESPSDQIHILGMWREREQSFKHRKLDLLFYDGAPFLSCIYASLFEPSVEDRKAFAKFLWITQKIWQEIIKDMTGKFPLRFKQKSFDFLFFLPVEFPAKPAEGRRYLEKQYFISVAIRGFLETFMWQDPRWHVINGSLEERISKVLQIINVNSIS